jgi:hypothetical protein
VVQEELKWPVKDPKDALRLAAAVASLFVCYSIGSLHCLRTARLRPPRPLLSARPAVYKEHGAPSFPSCFLREGSGGQIFSLRLRSDPCKAAARIRGARGDGNGDDDGLPGARQAGLLEGAADGAAQRR